MDHIGLANRCVVTCCRAYNKKVGLINGTREPSQRVGTTGFVRTNLSADNEPQQSWACQYCEREFGTKIGLGVHKSRAHRDNLDLELAPKTSDSSRKRWTHEEDLALAKLVVELQRANTQLSKTAMSEMLVGQMHNRSAESIRAHLKSCSYKKVHEEVERTIDRSIAVDSEPCGGVNHLDEETNNISDLTIHHNDVSVNPTDSAESGLGLECGQSLVSQQTSAGNVDEANNPTDNEQELLVPVEGDSELRAGLRNAAKRLLRKLSKDQTMAAKYKIKRLIRILHLPRGNPRVQEQLGDWIITVTAPNDQGEGVIRRSKRKFALDKGVNRGLEGKHEHAFIQNLYKRKGTKAVSKYIFQDLNVLKGSGTGDDECPSVGTEEMFESWSSAFMGSNVAERTLNFDSSYVCDSAAREILDPITGEEVRQNELGSRKAPGLDGLKASQWKQVPCSVRSAFYNIILYHGVVLDRLAKARTIFIAKTPNPKSPGEFRPISITSVIQRQLHKMLGSRLNKLCKTSGCQVAFKNVDGVATNIGTLQTVIEHSRNNLKDLHIVSIDLKKAFDSVSHTAIIEMAVKRGLPVEFVEYLATVYSKAATQLQFEGEIRDTDIGQGTFQGDPLSPILFNLVIDDALESMDKRFGYRLDDGTRAKCTAFADDVMVLGNTKTGVQLNINTLASQLALVGLQINPEKCMSISLVADRKRKRSGLDISGIFTAPVESSTHQIKPISHTSEWKYLGIKFTGTQVEKQLPDIRPYLQRLDTAKLTAQQKLEVLSNNVINRWIHKATFNTTNQEELKLIDKPTRGYVRKWLHLPKDVPNAYIHAPTRVGGVGVFELALRIPVSRANRLEGVIDEHFMGPSLRNSQFYQRIKKQKVGILNEYGVEAGDCDLFGAIYSKQLESKWATQGLTESIGCVSSRAWVRSKADKVRPYDYIAYHQVSSNSLPTKARRNWGRTGEQSVECRAGCRGISETAHHILQECATTHGMRVRRHDRVVDLICSRSPVKDNLTIIKEPQFETINGTRKPDLVILAQDGHAHVVDVQVCGRYDLKRMNTEKASKYASIPGFSNLVRGCYNAGSVSFHAVTIAFTGIIEKTSAALLLKLGFSKTLLHMLSTSVLRGSYIQWRMFNKRFGWT